jgi:hypothetical protein
MPRCRSWPVPLLERTRKKREAQRDREEMRSERREKDGEKKDETEKEEEMRHGKERSGQKRRLDRKGKEKERWWASIPHRRRARAHQCRPCNHEKKKEETWKEARTRK